MSSEEDAAPDFLNSSEVASWIRVPVGTLGHWRFMGKGPRSFKLGRHVLYAREDVEAYIEQARASDPSSSR